LQFLPQVPHIAAFAVTACLLAGLAGLVTLWRRGKNS